MSKIVIVTRILLDLFYVFILLLTVILPLLECKLLISPRLE
jgi:hypothetical protein